MQFKHIIWDFDGTLFDTYPSTTQALILALQRRGLDAPYDEAYGLLKQTVGVALKFYHEKFGLGADFDAEFNRIRNTETLGMCVPYPGIRPLLEDINAAGGYNYISTNRDGMLFKILDIHGMTSLFRGFATSEDKLPLKPDPAMNIMLIEKFAMDKSEAVIIGDRELDVVSGQRAGIRGMAYSDGSGSPIPCADFTATSISQMRALLLG